MSSTSYRLASTVAACAALALGCGGSEKPAPEPPPAAKRPPPPPEPEEPAEPEPIYTHGRFVWFSHWSKNEKELARARAFYADAFGWEIQAPEGDPAGYLLIVHGGREIGTISVRPGHKGKAAWIGYVSVADVDETVAAAGDQGGKAVGEPTDMEGVGRFAHVAGPGGAVLGVVTAERGDRPFNPDAVPEQNSFVWMEYWARKGKRRAEALAFLIGAVGYQQSDLDFGGRPPFAMLAFDDQVWAGVGEARQAAQAGRWVPYVAVDDVGAAVAAMREAKGRVVVKPVELAGVGRFAVVEDPVGALIGVIEPAGNSEEDDDGW